MKQYHRDTSIQISLYLKFCSELLTYLHAPEVLSIMQVLGNISNTSFPPIQPHPHTQILHQLKISNTRHESLSFQASTPVSPPGNESVQYTTNNGMPTTRPIRIMITVEDAYHTLHNKQQPHPYPSTPPVIPHFA